MRKNNLSFRLSPQRAFAGLIFLLISMGTGIQPSLGQNPTKMSAGDWREDLRFFAEQMPRRHKNLFHAMSHEEFDAAVKRLDEKIPTLSDDQIVVEFMRIVALVRDGHTHVQPFPYFKSGAYPVRYYLYKDGLFVQRAAPALSELVGAKVIKIGNAPWEQAIAKVSQLVAHDNEMGIKNDAPFLLSIPEVLRATGISSEQSLKIVVEKEGKEKAFELQPSASHADIFVTPSSWIDTSATGSAGLLWQRQPQNPYWFEYLKDQKILYIQFNAVQNKPDEPLATFFNRALTFATVNPVDKLVIDLRHNGGGNNGLNRAVIISLIKSNLNESGKLFAIIGRETFSAAQNFVNELEKYTNVTFVGEPTAANPNHYGDAVALTLPHSRLVIRASTLWWQDVDPRDNRPWTAPQVAADLSSDDYRTNRDPALQAIQNYIPGNSFADLGSALISNSDIKAFITNYRKFKADPVNAYNNTEAAMNRLGYALMQRDQLQSAVQVFSLNVEAYPKSANVYDSLAEAQLRSGNKSEAIRNYEKALSIDPHYASAIEGLKQLREQ